MAVDDRSQFRNDRDKMADAMHMDTGLRDDATRLFARADHYDWSYQWDWLGIPIIQIPTDVIASQEIVWATRPQLIIETGVARGGSLIFWASMMELIGEGSVLGIDVDIRPHNREAIEGHRLSRRIELLEGSSVDPGVIDRVRALAAEVDRVMVVLDSNHTDEHVAAELEAYAPLVTSGQYLVVADTIIEYIPEQTHRPRPWGPGNNPATAVERFLAANATFQRDGRTHAKLLLTSSPGGYLRRR